MGKPRLRLLKTFSHESTARRNRVGTIYYSQNLPWTALLALTLCAPPERPLLISTGPEPTLLKGAAPI